MRERRDDGLECDTDPGRLDLDLVHSWLSKDSYWAANRTLETVRRSFAHSIGYGVYRPDGAQVAVARVVTDRATFAWLSDVYVDPAARGAGVGTWLAHRVVADLSESGVYRIALVTRDAHDVYAKAGFVPVRSPERWMEIDTRTAPP